MIQVYHPINPSKRFSLNPGACDTLIRHTRTGPGHALGNPGALQEDTQVTPSTGELKDNHQVSTVEGRYDANQEDRWAISQLKRISDQARTAVRLR